MFIFSSFGIFVYRVATSKKTRNRPLGGSPFSNYHVHLYVANCSIFNFLFSFSGRRKQKRFVLKRVGAQILMFKSGCNNRGVAGVKDIVANREEITSCQVGL